MMALIIAVAMVLGMTSMTAFAADPPGSITIKPSDTVTLANKTLKAYKILDATYSGTGTDQAVSYTIPASMVSFYDSYFGVPAVTEPEPIPAKTATQAAAAAGMTLDAYVANQMKDWGDNSAKIKDFSAAALAAAKTAGIEPITGSADGDNIKFANLASGYYVIEDEGSAQPISALMLDTVTNANVDITLKASDDSKKEIMTAGDLVNSKANELGLGRAVNFKVSQKIPDTTGYDYYYYMINDKLSAGLTFNPGTVVVKVGGTTLTAGQDYYLYYDDGSNSATNTQTKAILGDKTFIVAFNDIVADIADTSKTTFVVGADVEITYSATVNSNAVVGVNPNNNEVNVQYSNNPDKDGKGDWDTNHPGIPKNDVNHPTGEGPKKYTDTYATKVGIIKKDGTSKTALSGVEFTLTGKAKDVEVNAEEVYKIDAAGTYWLLKDGKYTTTPPTTEATLQETTGGAGWVEIVSGDTYAGADIRVVGGKKYRPYVEATDSAKTRYVIIEPNDDKYTSITTKYSKTTAATGSTAVEYDVARSGVTGSDGKLDFSQLGAGTYKLSETGILAGYNGIPDIDFTITCTLPAVADVVAGTETATWNISSNTPGVTFTPGTGDDLGTFTITIENNKGTELPSTGGIGTTIFYVVGAILVIGAGVVLITRRRMDA